MKKREREIEVDLQEEVDPIIEIEVGVVAEEKSIKNNIK